MAIMYLLGWWYGQGWVWILKGVSAQLSIINQTFSVPILIKTLFAPWKQIQTVQTFRNFFQSAVDNFISRWIGATVRIGMLILAALSTLTVILCGTVAFLLWPLLPLLIIGLPIASAAQVGF